jgi:hypothetical protein
MKALIYHGPEKKNWESKADPAVELDAYDTFADAARTDALKVALSAR